MVDNRKEIISENVFEEINTKIRDLEEKQKMLRDRLLIIGQNLIEIKEKISSDILEIKKSLEIMKSNLERLTSFLETASTEFQKFAKKEDLELLSKKIKMSQALKQLVERGKK